MGSVVGLVFSPEKTQDIDKTTVPEKKAAKKKAADTKDGEDIVQGDI